MVIAIILLFVLLLVFAPQWWVTYVLQRHSKEQDHFQGSGGELASHLLDRFGLDDVVVETTESGDHYDPATKAVRLSRDNIDRKSLTAIAIAAHEVGHALQHQQNYSPLRIRSNLVRWAQHAEKLGSTLMFLVPVVAIVSRSPLTGAAMLLLGIASLSLSVIVHVLTLPVEWDASFNRALPILEEGYISAAEQRQARTILTAAALTYVAASLASLLNLWRWLAILRR